MEKREGIFTDHCQRQRGQPGRRYFLCQHHRPKSIQPDSLADNILSNLLLTSDLKGYVEDPAFYFLNQDARTLRSIDYLMMTHGWRRHKMENVLRTPSLNFTNYIEKDKPSADESWDSSEQT